ncbi:MAG TPA: NAD-dependent epimerase/dehydratase family protein [Cyclobacteriaceae bacterium]|jgi:dihydroflavonol-4-reductase|nr:NAD-dependent epimerase/dehydratase family protein [Cytophagales bacterium]HNT50679.1 NAD-dependent epimerase/dehydratase family protein [Cyclobacteriaceae bacterium]HRE66357.1 NAD-dependent epimerase/dehydratase family protein [Cyclobacteriaceae bacterium]HRF32821.1 NAD-dependent epimerase/dehydratase family protein [Cyclobacteriaceae bacterium]
MKVLVTGASGLLGTHVVLALQQQGIPVRAMVRTRNKYLLNPHSGTEVITGDLTDARMVKCAVAGCTHIIHAAALTCTNEPRYQQYYRVNVEATVTLAEVAAQAHVQRMVYVSTANTIGFGSMQYPGTEVHAMRAPFTRMGYARSKQTAEQSLEKHASQLDVVTVHPTFMLGAYDAGNSSGQIVRMVLGKRIIFYPPGGKNFAPVVDVAQGIIRALLLGKRNEHYLLANENTSYRNFYKRLCRISNQQAWLVPVPGWLLFMVGVLGSGLQWAGVRTSLTLANMKALCVHNYYDNTKAKKELGIVFTSVDKAMEDAVTWFKR